MDIEVTRGRQATYDLALVDTAGRPVNLTGKAVTWVAGTTRDGTADLGPVALAVINAEGGVARLVLPASLTSALPAGALSTYRYEVSIAESGGDPAVVLRGILYVLPAVG